MDRIAIETSAREAQRGKEAQRKTLGLTEQEYMDAESKVSREHPGAGALKRMVLINKLARTIKAARVPLPESDNEGGKRKRRRTRRRRRTSRK